jgi:O-methyltransferase
MVDVNKYETDKTPKLAQNQRNRCQTVQNLDCRGKIEDREFLGLRCLSIRTRVFSLVGRPRFLDVFRPVQRHSLVGAARCWVLYSAIRQAMKCEGEFWECGVYKGGTAQLLRQMRDLHAKGRKVRLFDSFRGMPETDAVRDVHKSGDFSDTSLEAVRHVVGSEGVEFHAGFIPETFWDLNTEGIAFAHIDLDLHDAVLESCKFIYPRLSRGGVMVFDDYGFPSCPGARIAVDEFFKDKPEFPMVLPTAQALIHRLWS